MKKYYFLGLFACLFCLSSCKDAKPSNQSSSSISEKDQIIDFIKDFKDELSIFSESVPSKKHYLTKQTDNYYGMEVESTQQGTYSLYNDNFIVNEFEQVIGDSIPTTGKEECGITDDNQIYNIIYYGVDDEANGVSYYPNNAINNKLKFNLNFATEYSQNILNSTITYYSLYDTKRLSLNTNFDNIDLSNDGTIVLQYRLTRYGTGNTIEEEIERDDILVIENGLITSCNTTMLLSLSDGINFVFMESDITYNYDELTDYTGQKLNPEDFPVAN